LLKGIHPELQLPKLGHDLSLVLDLTQDMLVHILWELLNFLTEISKGIFKIRQLLA
jgi:hypothetical protein